MPLVQGTRNGKYRETLAEYARAHGPAAVMGLDPAQVVPGVAERRDAVTIYRERYGHAPALENPAALAMVQGIERALCAIALDAERERARAACGGTAPTATGTGSPWATPPTVAGELATATMQPRPSTARPAPKQRQEKTP